MKKKKGSGLSHTLEADVNVTPVMNLFVVLIPFLLFSAVFVKIAVINIALPGRPGEFEEFKKAPNAPDVNVSVGVSKSRLIIAVSGDKNYSEEIELTGNVKPLKDFHRVLVRIKKDFPTKKDIIVLPDRNVKYEQIVNILDVARDLLPDDPPIYARDVRGETVRLRTLFPDVVLGSI